jgi:hypothetical protein
MVIVWSIAVAGIQPIKVHWAYGDGWRNIITHAESNNPLK